MLDTKEVKAPPVGLEPTGKGVVRKTVGFSALVTMSVVAGNPSDANVSKLMSQIKVPSNVISDTAPRGLAAKLHTGDALPSCHHRSD